MDNICLCNESQTKAKPLTFTVHSLSFESAMILQM